MKIYYFSGTGNSLYIAKQLSEKLGAELVCISDAVKADQVYLDSDGGGFVFPVYFASNMDGVPLIIKRFVKKLKNIENKYLFAVCTSEHTPGTTMGSFKKLVKKQGGKLSTGFIVNMSDKSLKDDLLNKSKKVSGVSDDMETSKFSAENRISAKLELIIKTVTERKTVKIETRSVFMRAVMFPLRLLIKPIFLMRYISLSGKASFSFNKVLPKCDNSFIAGEQCTGCGTCVKVCPVGNILLSEGKPKWNHSCENCLACYVWCPKKAIGGEIVKYNENRHNENIKLQDVI